jgi:hypothetical protein
MKEFHVLEQSTKKGRRHETIASLLRMLFDIVHGSSCSR